MGLVDFDQIMEIFGGSSSVPDAETKKSLLEEVLLLTLSRATTADSNIDAVEVETVQKIILEMVGTEVSCKDIRVAAISDLYKEATLERYLSKVAGKLELADKQVVVESLSKVIKVDEKISPFEVEFFNDVATALGLTPAQLTGLV